MSFITGNNLINGMKIHLEKKDGALKRLRDNMKVEKYEKIKFKPFETNCNYSYDNRSYCRFNISWYA